jgi:hypothetical protein
MHACRKDTYELVGDLPLDEVNDLDNPEVTLTQL